MYLKKIINSLIFLSLLFPLASLPAPAFSASPNDYGLTATAQNAQLPSSIKGQTNMIGVIGVVVKLALSLVGMFFLGLMLYAGIVWMKSMGASDDVERAKQIIQSAIIGLIIVSAAYAITNFVFTNLSASDSDKCSAQYSDGVCILTDQCQAPKKSTPGLCPGAANIQCCHS